MNIYQALSAVMADVGAVRKDSKNQSQGFNFRGIDSVVNAVSPALRKHGVIVFPQVHTAEYSTVSIGSKGTQMGHCRVKVTYTFVAEDGSSIESTVVAESMDSGDKATAKAMSVAFRTCLLQTLCLPTDEPDPDHDVYERAPKQQAAARPIKSDLPSSGISKAQRMYIEKCTANHVDGTMGAISDILNRLVKSWDDVTLEDLRVILPAISTKENN